MYLKRPEAVPPDTMAVLLQLMDRLDLQPGPGGSRITPLGKDLPLWQGQLQTIIPTPWHWAGVVALYPSKQISAHADPPIPNIRIHIPLIVNPNSWVFHDGSWQQLLVGALYEMDPTKVHGAVNWGPAVRRHLMIDLL